MKKTLGKLIPYPLIRHGRRLVHAGFRRCLVCDGRVRSFKDFGYGFPVLEELQVVGGLRRRADICPLCHSGSRERLIWFWLTQGEGSFRFPADARIAHFAPEKGLSEKLAKTTASYRAFDFDPSRYRHLAGVEPIDLNDLALPDDSVDLLVCNHVLEHVPDAPRAMRNIARVLSPKGVAILQVPIALKLDGMVELSPDSSARERVERAGQDDHLRLFSRQAYTGMLSDNGLEVETFEPFEHDAEGATAWSLDPFETLFVCRKSGA